MKSARLHRYLLAGLLFPFIVFAQQSKIDSLYKVLKKVSEDTSKVNALNQLSYEYENIGKFGTADSTAKKALSIATGANYLTGQAGAYKQIGATYEDQGNYAQALDNYLKAIAIRKQLKDDKGTAATLVRLGLVYQEEGDYVEALDRLQESLELFTKIKDKHGIAYANSNMGVVYESQGKYPQALSALFNSLEVLEQLNGKTEIADLHESIGNVYNEQKNYKKAQEEYENAMKIYEQLQDKSAIANTMSNIGLVFSEQNGMDSLALQYYRKALDTRYKIGDKNGIAISLINIGGIYFKEENYNQALDNFNKSYQLFQEVGNKDGIGNCLNAIGQIYINQKNYKQALEYENKCLELYKQIGSLEGIEGAYEQLSNLYELMHDGQKAFENYKLYVSTRDSLFNKENTRKTVEAEMNFKFEKKQAIEQADQEKKEEVQKEEERKQQIIIYFISGILLLVCGFAVFAYRSYLQKQKVNRELDSKNQELAEKNKDITDSINYAKRIQTAILVPKEDIAEVLPEFFLYYRPKDIVSGDFYYFANLKASDAPSTIIIAAVDCTGHGVPGAFMSMIGNDALTHAVMENNLTEPAEILSSLNDGVRRALKQTTSKAETQDGMDAALCTYTPEKKELQFAGAFRNLIMIRNNTGTLEEIKGDRQSIGGEKSEVKKIFKNYTLQVTKGDCFYIFTDGYADQFGGERGKKFLSKNFENLLVENRKLPMSEQEAIIHKSFQDWKGTREQVDDVLVIGIRVS
jgi:tetratricopeptide (TPR) repeat protein